MRTTLTLDPDVARLIEEEVHRRRSSMKDVVNDAIRRGLRAGRAPAPVKPYRLRAHKTTLAPGIDATRLNALADELDDDVAVSRIKRRATSR